MKATSTFRFMTRPAPHRLFFCFIVLLALLSGPTSVWAQAGSAASPLKGQVLDQATKAPVAYASIAVLHQPVGTVADDQGNFALSLPATNDLDSLRIALLGYAPLTVQVGAFRRQLAQGSGQVLLRAVPTQLAEVLVRPGKQVRRVVGNSTNSTRITGGFKVNELGNQLAQGMHLRRPATLEQVSFHVAKCTYDSLFYRINVYQVVKGQPSANLLPEPVYVRVRKGQIKDRIVADLHRFNLTVQGDIAVALEMVKNLGPGELMLSIGMLGGPLYFSKQTTSGWEKVSGFGVGIDATVTEYQNK